MQTSTKNIAAKFTGILAFLTTLCINPLVIGKLLTADGNLESGKVILFLWLITVGLGFMGYRYFTSINPKIKYTKIAQLFLAGVLTFFLTVFADRLMGKLLLKPTQNLLFSANSAVRYNTAEFDVTAKINSLGFRDYEYPVVKENKYRILVIGDSFTFGWGVKLEETWVKQLEAKFKKENPNIELLNLGRSGGSPETYADIAARTVPILKPDLVLVAILQGNDLAQSIPVQVAPNIPHQNNLSLSRLLSIFRANAYPNILRLLHKTNEQDVQPVWQRQAKQVYDSLALHTQHQLLKLPKPVLSYFFAGTLNPDLLHSFIQNPNYYNRLEKSQSPEVQRATQVMTLHLKKIKNIAARYQAKTVLISVPNKYYLCKQAMQEHQQLGLTIDTSLIRKTKVDSLLQLIARETSIPLLFPEKMQAACQTQKIYYKFDSHFTPVGNKVFADAIFPKLKAQVLPLTKKP